MSLAEKVLFTIRGSLGNSDVQWHDKMGSVAKWDSLRHLKVIFEIERAFNVRVPNLLIGQLTSPEKITQYVKLHSVEGIEDEK